MPSGKMNNAHSGSEGRKSSRVKSRKEVTEGSEGRKEGRKWKK
jgi:hypothetical protein